MINILDDSIPYRYTSINKYEHDTDIAMGIMFGDMNVIFTCGYGTILELISHDYIQSSVNTIT